MSIKKIEEALDIEHYVPEENSIEIIPVIEDDIGENDLEFVKKNLYEIINKSAGALDELIEIASSSERPSAYEAAATLIKASLDANKQLQDLVQYRRNSNIKNSQSKNVTNNNLFVGSATELLDMIQKKKNESQL